MNPPIALSVAGTDSGGGAGIAADLRAFAANGVFGTFAVTAVTAQDTAKVYRVVKLTPEEVGAQIDAVLGDFRVGAAKTGMLASVEMVEMLAERAESGGLPPLVVDPVLVASTGSPLFNGNAIAPYRRLFGSATVATPNLREAGVLLRRPIEGLEGMREAARELQALGTGLVVVKGGHLDSPDATDVCFDGTDLVEISAARVPTTNVHGTGCTLSAAIAAHLARGATPLEAVRAAKAYVSAAIAGGASWDLGAGHGPLQHFPPGYPIRG